MICQFCKKNVATVHLTELVEGKKQEIHLCEKCARKKGLSIKTHFSLQDLLSGLMEREKEKLPEEILSTKCPSCGLTFREFRDSGRFGCPRDYQVFKEGLTPLLDRVHGSSKHVGKVPKRVDSDTAKARALLDLRNQLEEAIHHEEYERAAEIRDRIRTVEEEESTSKDAGQSKRKSKPKSRTKEKKTPKKDEDAAK